MKVQFLCAALLPWAGTAPVAAHDFTAGTWVDLSHPFSERTLYWPTSSTFHKETVFEGKTEGGWYYTAYDIRTAEHGGTHIDAPVHFAEGRQTVDRIPLERLVGPAVVIDISSRAADNPDYQFSADDLLNWEAAHGPIGDDVMVLINTGFARYWPDARRYLGTAQRGAQAVALLHFPGIHPEAARMLVERGVRAVGLDTASIDYGQSGEFMTHRILFEADIPGFENLADLSALPARGALVVALPMKIEGGSGGPLRIVAFVPGN
jgi:kynurenine formamidase